MIAPNIRLKTSRLELIAGTRDTATAELDRPEELQQLLGARLPAPWPPPLNDVGSMTYFLQFILHHPDAVGWGAWYIVARPSAADRVVIGNCGFKGKPTTEGMVELGYSLFPEFQGQGYATEAVSGLVRWAFAHPEVTRVAAETYPDHVKSMRVLEKNGFLHIGGGLEAGTIRFEVVRGAFED